MKKKGPSMFRRCRWALLYFSIFLLGIVIGLVGFLTINSYAMSDSLFTFCMELF